MASEVYVLSRIKWREAWWQLTEDERQGVMDGIRNAREGIAVKRLARFAVGQSVLILLSVYPDMESYCKYQMFVGPQGLDVRRYFDFDVTLGYEAPPQMLPGLSFSAQDDLPLV